MTTSRRVATAGDGGGGGDDDDDDDGTMFDPRKHARLLRTLATKLPSSGKRDGEMDGDVVDGDADATTAPPPRKALKIGEVAERRPENQFAAAGSGGVTLSDLVNSIQSKQEFGSVLRQMEKLTKVKVCERL